MAKPNTWQSTPWRGTPIDWTHPLAAGLVGAWAFNERSGPTFTDLAYSAVVNTGLLSGTGTWGSGRWGDAYNLAGASNFIGCGFVNELNGATRATILFLGNRAAAQIAVVGRCVTLNNGINILAHSDNNAYFQVDAGGASAYGLAAMPAGDFALCLTYDGTQATNPTRLQGYINGFPASLTFTGTIPASIPTRADAWTINQQLAASRYGTARYDGVFLWVGRTLQPQEVASLSANPWQLFQPYPAFLAFPTGRARVSQEPVEVLRSHLSTATARVSQAPVEVLRSGAAAKARVSQLPVEVLASTAQRASPVPWHLFFNRMNRHAH